MREIKFRCWAEKDKAMYPCSSPWMGNVMAIVEGGDRLVFECFVEDNVKVMQFTGLKSKSGQDIYEGDILNHPEYLNGTKKGNYISAVKWGETGDSDGYYHNAHYEWMVKNNKSDSLADIHANSEVIGNIYENPEFLKNT